jgi:trigger factor
VNVTVENVAACRKKLSIEVPANEVAQEWKGVLSEFQKYAQIPGFRVGRAPLQVLEKKFEKEIGDEVQRKLIPTSFREAVAKEKLKIVSSPAIDEIKFQRNEGLKFLALVDVSPEFTLPNYKGLKLTRPKSEVTQEQVDNAVTLLAEQQASFEDVSDRPLAMGDFAIISYNGLCEGKPIAEFNAAAKPLSENKQFWLLMAKDSFLPGFCDALVGAKIGDKKEISVDFPADFRINELAGKKASYSVEILGIKQKQLPPIDDQFAKNYKCDSLQQLKDRVRENMVQERERNAGSTVKGQAVEQLVKACAFELPESIVQDETRTTMMDIVRENQARGVNEDTIRERSKDILVSAKQNAEEKVRATFILRRIAEDEKIEVKPEELNQELEMIALQHRRPVTEVRKQLEESGQLEAVREQVLVGKALDLVISNANVEEEKAP